MVQISELEQSIGSEIIKRIERTTDRFSIIGATLGVTILPTIFYYIAGNDINVSQLIPYTGLVGLHGFGSGMFFGYHAGREWAAMRLQREYPTIAESIRRWEKLTHSPM